MKVLRDSTGPVDRGAIAHATKEEEQLQRALHSLLVDGLIVDTDGKLGLPR